MKILLVNIDSKIPNLALYKIEKYHLDFGDIVDWFDKNNHFDPYNYDKIFVSCILSWNKWKTNYWADFEHAAIGGSGVSLSINLQKEIEDIKPKINLGFATRGCNRNCDFCIVPEKEGKVKVVGDVHDIWDGKSKEIMFLDNNILMLPDHFKLICSQLRDKKLKVDFNQGLDIRLMTDDLAKEFSIIKFKKLRFAWDFMNMEKIFLKNMKKVFKYVKPSRVMVYMLVGYNTTFKEDMYRLKKIRSLGCDAFVMKYNNQGDLLLREFARWNNLFFFRNLPFESFLKRRNNLYLLNRISS